MVSWGKDAIYPETCEMLKTKATALWSAEPHLCQSYAGNCQMQDQAHLWVSEIQEQVSTETPDLKQDLKNCSAVFNKWRLKPQDYGKVEVERLAAKRVELLKAHWNHCKNEMGWAQSNIGVRNGEAKQTSQQADGHVPCHRQLQWMLPKQLSSGGNWV